MRARRGAALLAACVAAGLGAVDSVPGEIRREVSPDGQIVAVNVRRHPAPRRTPPAPGGGRTGPAVQPPSGIAEILEETSARHGFDPAFIRAVVLTESGFDPMAVSSKGARGLMQLMPATARQFGVRNVYDPSDNLEAGVAYLRELSLRHPGRMDLALAAYNAGPEAVSRHGGIPPYRETREYVARVRAAYGADLNGGDWSHRRGAIRVKKGEGGGVPHFTNLRRRRIIRPDGASMAARQAPGPGGDQR